MTHRAEQESFQLGQISRQLGQKAKLEEIMAKFVTQLKSYVPHSQWGITFAVNVDGAIALTILDHTISARPRLVRMWGANNS
jgi:hypothetical protein